MANAVGVTMSFTRTLFDLWGRACNALGRRALDYVGI